MGIDAVIRMGRTGLNINNNKNTAVKEAPLWPAVNRPFTMLVGLYGPSL